MAHLTLGIGRDSLLDPTLGGLLNLVLDPSVYFLAKYNITESPAKSVYQTNKQTPPWMCDHFPNMIKFLTLTSS